MTVEWFGQVNLNQVTAIVEWSEKASAERIEKEAIASCPVGEWERSVSGGPKHGGKSWTARKPGALRDSIKARKSKFKDGGWIVIAGNEDVFYASFVELGVPAHDIKKRPFMRRAKKNEEKKFYNYLKAKLT